MYTFLVNKTICKCLDLLTKELKEVLCIYLKIIFYVFTKF